MVNKSSNTPQNTAPPQKKDFLEHYGKNMVAILFTVLIGDALPAIIQNGLQPNKVFYTLVLITLPYTGTLALVFRICLADKMSAQAKLLLSALLLLLGVWLGSATNWGFSEADLANFTAQNAHTSLGTMINSLSHGSSPYTKALGTVAATTVFYTFTYGIPTFLSATAAAFVIAWNLKEKPRKGESVGCAVVMLACILGLALFGASSGLSWASVGGSSSSSVSFSASSSLPPPTPIPPTYKVIWNHSYDSYSYIYGGQQRYPSSENHFIVVNVTVQNLSDYTQSFSLSSTFTLYSEGDQSSWAADKAIDRTITLDPGYQDSFDVVFVVPNDACRYDYDVSAWGYSDRWTDAGC